MKNLFHITLLLMLSLSVFGNESRTLETGVKIAKGLSPEFFEDVMKYIRQIESDCANSATEIGELIKEEKLKSKAKAQASGQMILRVVDQKKINFRKEILRNRKKVISAAITSQIEKVQALKDEYQTQPVCHSDSVLSQLGSLYPAFLGILDTTFGHNSPHQLFNFNYSIKFLEEIRTKIDESSDSDIESGESSEEVKAYKFCSARLMRVIKEADRE